MGGGNFLLLFGGGVKKGVLRGFCAFLFALCCELFARGGIVLSVVALFRL